MKYRAIHRKVLVVATDRSDLTWKAYVVPVPGKDHSREADLLWQTEGSQLPESEARAFFPDLALTEYAR